MIAVESARRKLMLGYLASLGAAISYGSVAVVGRKIVTDHTTPLVATAFSMLIGTMVVALIFHRDVAHDVTNRAPSKAWMMTALAGCTSAWGVTSYFFALQAAPVVLVAPVSATSPLVSIALTHIFLQRLERVTWRTVAGAGFVVIGVILIGIGST